LGARLYSRRLVEVQERSAEEEQRRKDQIGEEERRALCSISLSVQHDDQRELRHAEDDRECRERSERMHVIGSPELETSSQRPADPELLIESRRNREADQGEPGDGR